MLADTHGRVIRKLRVSLIDACNFRCFYCMPEKSGFMPQSKLLNADEIFAITSALVERGIEEVRITGGEPTIRTDFREIVSKLAQLDLKKLGLTTNGYFLDRHIDFLNEVNCRHINVSLDSLNADKFNKITRRKAFDRTFANILDSQQAGLPIKLNVVLMRGVNDDEIMDFVKFSEAHRIPVRFLEVMRIGQVCSSSNDLFMAADQAIDVIGQHRDLAVLEVPRDSTSFNFKTSDGGEIGFIASESRPFCGNCSRWRLSADGFLRACLMSQKGVKIGGVPLSDYPQLITDVLAMKPTGRIVQIEQNMNQIGG
jgi:GTP 3',8-cyclase